MFQLIKNKAMRFMKSEDGFTGTELAGVVATVLVLGGTAVAGLISENESAKPDIMYQANAKFVSKLITLVKDDATIASSDLSASVPVTAIPYEFKRRSSVIYGPHGGSVIPTGDGSRGLILTWNGVDQEHCKEFLARYAQEDGSGRLTGISVNAAAQTLPVGLTARGTACDESGDANVVALTYDVDKG